jgi:hypothetical protein
MDSLYPPMSLSQWMDVKMYDLAVRMVRFYVDYFVMTDIPVVHENQ